MRGPANIGAAMGQKDPRQRLASARRVVVKVGTNVLMRDDGALALGRVYGLVESVAGVIRSGREVLLVSSGAVGLGAQRLGLPGKPKTLVLKQACAAIGQSRLMAVYDEGFGKLGVTTAQVLLTEGDFADRTRYLNLKATLLRLLSLGTVPILNENDAVSTLELVTPDAAGKSPVFGDNDKLSALVAAKMDADLLVLLSDVDGLYTGNPARSPSARRVPIVAEVTAEVVSWAEGGGARGRGGMRTKLEAARIATTAGACVVVADGRAPQVLDRVLSGEDVGTLFLPHAPIGGRRRWIAWASAPAATVVVNAGAREALLVRKASLLPAGVVSVEGEFAPGDVVAIRDEAGQELARGRVNFGSGEARQLLGRRSADAARSSRRAALVDRDDLVFTSLPAPGEAPEPHDDGSSR